MRERTTPPRFPGTALVFVLRFRPDGHRHRRAFLDRFPREMPLVGVVVPISDRAELLMLLPPPVAAAENDGVDCPPGESAVSKVLTGESSSTAYFRFRDEETEISASPRCYAGQQEASSIRIGSAAMKLTPSSA